MTPSLKTPRVVALILAISLALPCLGSASSHEEPFPEGPRKAIVSTTIFDMWRKWVSLDYRINEISQQIDKMAADSVKKYGRAPDIFVLPENSLNQRNTTLLNGAEKLEGKIAEKMGAKARQYNAYVLVCFNRIEDEAKSIVYNSAVLFDRSGEIAGVYRKVFPIANMGSTVLEGGKMPGLEYPVFQTDFARIGVLICWDMGFEEVPAAYASQGAELILWPTMSPQTLMPRETCQRYGFYLASATPRDNASILDPLGHIVAQTTAKDSVVCYEIDFDYRILNSQPGLEEGKALKDAFGDRVGFRYSTTEDGGIFWSNDPAMPIGQMLEQAQLISADEQRDQAVQLRYEMLEAVGAPSIRLVLPNANLQEDVDNANWIRWQGLSCGYPGTVVETASGMEVVFHFSHGWDWNFLRRWQEELLSELPAQLGAGIVPDGFVSPGSSPWRDVSWMCPTIYLYEGCAGTFLSGRPFGWLWVDQWSSDGGFWAYAWNCQTIGWLWVHRDGYYYALDRDDWLYILPDWTHAWSYSRGDWIPVGDL